MPIRRSKSVLADLYRRINRLSRNNGAGEILSRGSRIFFSGTDSQKPTAEAGRSKARTKNNRAS
jgi:hypothetical protein